MTVVDLNRKIMYLRRIVLSFKSTRVPLRTEEAFTMNYPPTQSFCSLLSSKEMKYVQVRCFIKGYAITVKAVLECRRHVTYDGPIFSWLQGVSYHRILLLFASFSLSHSLSFIVVVHQ